MFVRWRRFYCECKLLLMGALEIIKSKFAYVRDHLVMLLWMGLTHCSPPWATVGVLDCGGLGMSWVVTQCREGLWLMCL